MVALIGCKGKEKKRTAPAKVSEPEIKKNATDDKSAAKTKPAITPESKSTDKVKKVPGMPPKVKIDFKIDPKKMKFDPKKITIKKPVKRGETKKPSCVADCVARNQMKATDHRQIESDCRKECSGK